MLGQLTYRRQRGFAALLTPDGVAANPPLAADGRACEARPGGRLDLPDAARYERNALASGADAGGFEVRRADHHVDMRLGAVDAAGGPRRPMVGACLREARAEGDVAAAFSSRSVL